MGNTLPVQHLNGVLTILFQPALYGIQFSRITFVLKHMSSTLARLEE